MNSIKLYADNVCVAEVFQAYDDGLITANAVRELCSNARPIHRDIPVQTNCPNCGAPITSHKCEYCGTVFDRNVEDSLQKQREECNRLRAELQRAQMNASIVAQTNSLLSVPYPQYGPFVGNDVRCSIQSQMAELYSQIDQNMRAAVNTQPVLWSSQKEDPTELVLAPVMTKETWIQRFKNFIRG